MARAFGNLPQWVVLNYRDHKVLILSLIFLFYWDFNYVGTGIFGFCHRRFEILLMLSLKLEKWGLGLGFCWVLKEGFSFGRYLKGCLLNNAWWVMNVIFPTDIFLSSPTVEIVGHFIYYIYYYRLKETVVSFGPLIFSRPILAHLTYLWVWQSILVGDLRKSLMI